MKSDTLRGPSALLPIAGPLQWPSPCIQRPTERVQCTVMAHGGLGARRRGPGSELAVGVSRGHASGGLAAALAAALYLFAGVSAGFLVVADGGRRRWRSASGSRPPRRAGAAARARAAASDGESRGQTGQRRVRRSGWRRRVEHATMPVKIRIGYGLGVAHQAQRRALRRRRRRPRAAALRQPLALRAPRRRGPRPGRGHGLRRRPHDEAEVRHQRPGAARPQPRRRWPRSWPASTGCRAGASCRPSASASPTPTSSRPSAWPAATGRRGSTRRCP